MSWAKGRVALVTGASRGIGAAVARRLVELGADVVVASRSKPEASLLRLKNVTFIPTDFGKFSDIEKLFLALKKRHKKLDIVINNAALLYKTSFQKISEAEWNHLMNVNMKAPFFVSQQAFKMMKKGGSIVNISSLAGIRSTQKFTDYSTYICSKFGVVGITEALAEEGRSQGIRVNCVAPGAVETAMLKQWDSHVKTNGTPDGLAQVIVQVAELGLTVLTGSTIEVPTSVWRDH